MFKSSTPLISIIFIPVFIVAGQLLMRFTGYSAWAAEVGQEFMLSFIFYMSALGVIFGGRAMVLLQRLQSSSEK